MRILEENNYILECWKCETKIIYTYKDCSFDSRYSSYELCCPNCHNRYSSTRNELFGKKYKENECNSDEKEIERLNNAFDCLEKEIRYYVIGNVRYDNNTAEYILKRLQKLKEENNE